MQYKSKEEMFQQLNIKNGDKQSRKEAVDILLESGSQRKLRNTKKYIEIHRNTEKYREIQRNT